ncbi:MAG: SHOCT domain-containing protein, partial [Thermofilum sp.]
SEEKLAEIARANGLNLEDLRYVIEAARPMPSPSDIVRFAVREVFNPAVVAKYGYLEDLPGEFIEELKKTGMEEKYAKMYWAAHWELPSLTVGFELFRRKVISVDELKLLMKLHDIAPGWRDKLLELAYELPTRVDLRRMYELGVISEQQLQEYYEKLGYKPEDAKLLTEWTKLEYNAEVRNLTVSKVLEYFSKGYIDRSKAKHYLTALGVVEDIAEIMLTDKEREMAERELEERIKQLRTLRSLGVITQEEFKNELAKLGLSPKAVEIQVKSVERERAARAKLPSLGDLKRWLKLGIISEEEFVMYLRELGYRERDIEKYIAEVRLSSIPAGE